MSKVTIQIDLDNDAFRGDDCGPELARVLETIAHQVKYVNRQDLEGHQPMPRDTNGNCCGFVSFEIDDSNDISDLLDDMDDDVLLDVLTELGDDVDENELRPIMEDRLRDHVDDGDITVAELRKAYSLPF